jgi:hypothetical protein
MPHDGQIVFALLVTRLPGVLYILELAVVHRRLIRVDLGCRISESLFCRREVRLADGPVLYCSVRLSYVGGSIAYCLLDLIRRNRNIMCIVQRSTKRTEGQLETRPHTPRYEDSYWDSVELHLALVGSRMTLL